MKHIVDEALCQVLREFLASRFRMSADLSKLADEAANNALRAESLRSFLNRMRPAGEPPLETAQPINSPPGDFDLTYAILVWHWKDAPQRFRDLSGHGGDEDWIAFVPAARGGADDCLWMQQGTAFGCCDVSEHAVDGGTVFIGAHA